MKEKCVKKNKKRPKGRQMLYTIYEYYKVDPSSGLLFGTEDLSDVVLHSDNLEAFIEKWDSILLHMEEPPNYNFMRSIFEREMKKTNRI